MLPSRVVSVGSVWPAFGSALFWHRGSVGGSSGRGACDGLKILLGFCREVYDNVLLVSLVLEVSLVLLNAAVCRSASFC